MYSFDIQRHFAHARWSEFIAKRRMEAVAIARPDPVVMKVDTPEFRSIFTKELEDLIELFRRYDHEIRVAGGAVRYDGWIVWF